MDFAALQRFAPLFTLATRESGSLTDDELRDVATAIAGDGADALYPLLNTLRSQEPAERVNTILASPTAQKIFTDFTKRNAAEDKAIFVKCPHCDRTFEETLG